MSVTPPPLRIHDVTGVNVLVNVPRFIATRKEGFTNNAYIFTSRPVRTGEKISVKILDVDTTQSSSHGLTFGLTSCDPEDIRPHRLPEDADDLMDREEYWVVCKDVVQDLAKNDALTFHVSDTGQILASRNGQTTALPVYVDKSIPLWAFFDLSGNTRKIEFKTMPPMTSPASDQSLHSGDIMFTTMMMNQAKTVLERTGIPTPFTSAISGATIRPLKKPTSIGGITATTPAVGSTAVPTSGSASPNTSKRPRPPVPPRPTTGPKVGTTTTSTGSNKSENIVGSNSNSPRGTDATSAPSRSSAQPADREECVICMDNLPDCVLLSCRHMCLCHECAENLRKDADDALCPVCRKIITDVIQVYR